MRLPKPGDLFAGKYQLLKLLGAGGFAHVFQARDTSIGRDVAVKILSPTDGGYPDRVRKRFMREARVISELHGPHTIRMFDFGTTPQGLLYMVFEFLAGIDLSSLLTPRKPLPPNIAEHILRQMLHGLAEAHSVGVIHRDIKPANVMVFEHLGDPHRIKLIDFGIAKLFALEQKVDLTKLTADGSLLGTPRYLAPEQFYGEDPTPAVDIYSAGLVGFEMLFGTPAIAGNSREQMLRNQLSGVPLEVPDLPGASHLTTTLRAMIAREPDGRPRSAGAALRLLDDSSRSLPTEAPAPPAEPAPERRAVGWFAGILIAALVIATGGLMLLSTEQGEARAPVRASPPTSIVKTTDDNPLIAATPADDKPAPARTNGGCSAPVHGMWADNLFHGLDHRPFHVWVPDRPAGTKMPVVLVAHRLIGSGREFIAETRFNDVADEFGFIVISMRFVGDPDIKQMARDFMQARDLVEERACVDHTRLFAVGHAGGGRHVRKLRCVLPLSAVATTSDGQLQGEQNCQTDPVPFMHVWGRDDPHLPRDGSSSCMGKVYLPPAKLKAEWATLNHCETGSKKWPAADTGDCEVLSCDATVVFCQVKGGFDWPQAPEPIEFPGCKSPPMDFPVGRTIWKFFAEHARQLD